LISGSESYSLFVAVALAFLRLIHILVKRCRVCGTGEGEGGKNLFVTPIGGGSPATIAP
jgi:hypothetical protein